MGDVSSKSVRLMNSAVNAALPALLMSAVLQRRCCRSTSPARTAARCSAANPPHAAASVTDYDYRPVLYSK